MRTLLGGCLLAAGILIAGASGLCSLLLLSMSSGWKDILPMLTALAIGIGLIVVGQRLISGDRGYL